MTETNRARQGEKIMLKNILITIFISAAILTGTLNRALAMLSAPDVIYHGTAINAEAGNTVIIAITLNGVTTTLASGTVGTDRSYELRVPMDSVDPRTAGTARSGDTAAISMEGVLVKTVTIPAFGTVVLLDLGTRTADQWAKDHPGDDGSGDMNRNGITDLAEYLAGDDPASCVWSQAAGQAETTVYHRDVLKNCLKDAGADQKHNLIRVARGTYAGNFGYKSEWGEAYDLTLIGGYDPAGIAERSADPALTVLNGDTDSDDIGNGIVLAVDTDTGKTGGKVHIESLTVKNGKAPAGQYGGGIQARIHQGDMELVGNIISNNSTDSADDNTADGGGGISIESSDSGSIFLTNNVVYGNSAANAAAARIVSSATGSIIILNNTIAGNAATAEADGRSIVIRSTVAAVDITNNIVSGVSGVSGNDVFVNSSGVTIPLNITHNDFHDAAGLLVNTPGFVSDASNIAGAPLFEATGNYRLMPSSPCIDKGIVHARTPGSDVMGAGRVAGAGIDLGAYEYHDLTKPVVNTFTALPRLNYLIADISIGATDDVAIIGYCVTESNNSNGCNWSATTPASYTFAIPGAKTLHAFVKDAAGNISEPVGATLTVSIPTLTVTVGGTGTGTVTSIPAGISCTGGSCYKTFSGTVSLHATPSIISTFGGWGGVCAGTSTPCNVSMDGAKTVSATFNAAAHLRIGETPYPSLQTAYNSAYNGAVIQLLGNIVTDTLNANRDITVILEGGYDVTFGSTPATTALTSPLILRKGKVVVDKIVIK